MSRCLKLWLTNALLHAPVPQTHGLAESHLLKVLQGWCDFVRVVQQSSIEVRAIRAIPCVVAVDPGQLRGEWREQVEECPGDDHVVVEANVKRDEDDCKANTLWKEAFIYN